MSVPRHVAIIPDGNRRWAASHGLSPSDGHMEGGKVFREISDAAFDLGVEYFTFWMASEDNLVKRSPVEIQFLSMLFKEELESEDTLRRCLAHNARLRVLGRWDYILRNNGLLSAVAKIEQRTSMHDKHHLSLLFGYDGRRELLEAVRDICEMYRERRVISEQADITADLITKMLWTGSLPPVDLVIRTGEDGGAGWSHYSSGFMMWSAANAKLFSTEKPWPDFSKAMFREVIENYEKTQRRFGA